MLSKGISLFGLALLVLTEAFVVQAEPLYLQIDTGNAWAMSPQLMEDFRGFLDSELSRLREEVSSIYWPAIDERTDFNEVFMAAFFPAGPKYKNREMQCQFIRRLLSSTIDLVQNEIFDLTRGGTVCIPGDLPKAEWANWTERLMKFLWSEKWISRGSEYVSMEDLIVEKIGEEQYKRPEFHIARRIEFDGHGWGFSPHELGLFLREPLLERYFALISSYDPNSEKPFRGLGPEVEKQLTDHPYGMVGTFQPGSKIYISSAFGPADLVELLAHEYGHVFHGEWGENLTWNSEESTLRL